MPEKGPVGGLCAPGALVRQLHLVGFTSDREGLIFAARRGAKTGGYVVTLDAHLLAEIDAARRKNSDTSTQGAASLAKPRVESALSPREMQARLRAGRSVAQVAAEAGVSIEWVERFAAPVIAEQIAAVQRARQLVLKTPRRGPSDRPLLESILRNLADRGIRLTDDEMDSGWSAQHLMDNEWLVRFHYRSRARDFEAEWLLDMASRDLVARNRLGTDLGYVDPGRHSAFSQELPPLRPRGHVRTSSDGVAPSPAARKAATTSRERPAKKAAAPRPKKSTRARAKKAPAAKKVPSAQKSSAGRKTVASKKAAVAKKAVAKKPPAKKSTRSAPSARTSPLSIAHAPVPPPAPARRPAQRVVAAMEAALAEPSMSPAAQPEAPRHERPPRVDRPLRANRPLRAARVTPQPRTGGPRPAAT